MEPLILIKLAFGILLGEIFRLQEHLGVNQSPNAAIYGLTHGLESLIDFALQENGALISDESFTQVVRLLRAYESEPGRPLNGYCDLEPHLNALGIGRDAAIRILKQLKAMGRFTETINRLNTEYSPPDCRNFDLTEKDCEPLWK